jgi:hypothetical protein
MSALSAISVPHCLHVMRTKFYSATSHDARVTRTAAPWHRGTAAPWHRGTVAPWHRGTVAPWHRGTIQG